MITKKTRALSIIASILMLVSMLACIVVPAGAEAVDEATLAMYWAVWEDSVEGSGRDTLEMILRETDSSLDEVIEAAKGAALKSGIKPRYAYKEAYGYAGYTDKVYSITEPADWLAMVADSVVTPDFKMDGEKKIYIHTGGDAGETFEGYTFYVTNDIDFGNVEMAPLNYSVGATDDKLRYVDEEGNDVLDSKDKVQTKLAECSSPFQGTIEGNGYSFKNININVTAPTSNYSCGLIGKLGANAVINNFGVDSGSITMTGATYCYIATFGEAIGAAKLNKVWSGAKVRVEGNYGVVGGILASAQYANAVINGASFFGTLEAPGTGYDDCDAFPMVGNYFRNDFLYNAIGSGVGGEGTTIDAMNDARGGGHVYTIINNFGVNMPVARYDIATDAQVVNSAEVESMGEAAYKINANQPAAEDVEAVYFTFAADGIARPNGTIDNRIVKATVKGSGADKTIYLNINKEYTKAEFAAMIGLAESNVQSIDGGNTAKVTADDAVINVVVNDIARLRTIVEGYGEINADYLTADAAARLAAFRAAPDAVEAGTMTVEEGLALEAGLHLKVGTYPNIPSFADYHLYKNYNEDNDWMIRTAEDWKAMRDIADEAAADYFAGYIFHLEDDVDFGQVQMAPMGITPTATAGFAGTIDGHGYGFDNIYVYSKSSYGDAHVVCGLFQRLSNCTFKDFGINSGLIKQGSSNNAGNTSTFGSVLPNKVPTFERIWSGAIVNAACNAQPSALVGTFSHGQISVNINGFVFDGEIAKGGDDNHNYPYAFGLYGTYNGTLGDGDNFYNIISNPAVFNAKVFPDGNGGYTYERGVGKYGPVNSALLAFSSEDMFAASTFENVYGVKRAEDSLQNGYFLGAKSTTAGASSASLLTDMSAFEVAYTINKNPSKGAAPVYFTRKGDKIRPVASAENMIVKATVTGAAEATVYINANEEMTFDALALLLGLQAGGIAGVKVNGVDATGNSFVVTADSTLETTSCFHTEITKTHIAGTTTHKLECANCDWEEIEDCSIASWTPAAEGHKHIGVCSVCEGEISQPCSGTLIVPTDDCTKDSYWDFDCVCGRMDETVFGSGNDRHTYGDWTTEGATEGKERKTCVHCETYVERYIGAVEVIIPEGAAVKAGETIVATVKLTYALTDATITLATGDGYSIESIEAIDGVAADENVLTLDVDEAAAIEFDVTLKADKYAAVKNGILSATLSNAKVGDEEASNNGASAEIAFEAVEGDANVDGKLNILDGLLVLRASVGENVTLNMAHSDLDYNGSISATDAVLVVRKWLAA